MSPRKRNPVSRRDFLKSAATGAAALATAPAASARPIALESPVPAAATDLRPPPTVEILTSERTGSDFMVDVIKTSRHRLRVRQSWLELSRSS